MHTPYKPQKTFQLKQADVVHNWYVLDASGKTLGRFASEITKVLRGKNKPTFTTYMDGGDGVIVINAEKIAVTGNKAATKVYHHYTGAIGGLRKTPYRTMQEKKPGFIIEHAVKAMMPRSRLANAQYKRLKVFVGSEHNMVAQKPITATI